MCIVIFHVQRFEPHTCIVTEGFGALEMHLFIYLFIYLFIIKGTQLNRVIL